MNNIEKLMEAIIAKLDVIISNQEKSFSKENKANTLLMESEYVKSALSTVNWKEVDAYGKELPLKTIWNEPNVPVNQSDVLSTHSY